MIDLPYKVTFFRRPGARSSAVFVDAPDISTGLDRAKQAILAAYPEAFFWSCELDGADAEAVVDSVKRMGVVSGVRFFFFTPKGPNAVDLAEVDELRML